MRPTLTRLLALAAFILPLLAGGAVATAQSTPVHMLELPVLVAACERDPGNRLQPGGGRFSPEQVMEEFGCDPAGDVAVTISNREIDFFARCETGEDGRCEVEAPTDPERELDVAVHLATVAPGLAPTSPVLTTVHYSEFTGVGVPLLPVADATPGAGEADEERATIAVNVARCEDGSTAAGCEREGVEALVQASTAEVASEGFPWLATNDEGWVSFDRASFDGDQVDLMLETDTEPRFACSDVKTGERLETAWVEGRDGNFIRLDTAGIEGDITCDITLL